MQTSLVPVQAGQHWPAGHTQAPPTQLVPPVHGVAQPDAASTREPASKPPPASGRIGLAFRLHAPSRNEAPRQRSRRRTIGRTASSYASPANPGRTRDRVCGESAAGNGGTAPPLCLTGPRHVARCPDFAIDVQVAGTIPVPVPSRHVGCTASGRAATAMSRNSTICDFVPAPPSGARGGVLCRGSRSIRRSGPTRPVCALAPSVRPGMLRALQSRSRVSGVGPEFARFSSA